MHTPTRDTRNPEISLRRHDGAHGEHPAALDRWNRLTVGRRPFLHTVIGGLAGVMAGAQGHGAAGALAPRGYDKPRPFAAGPTQSGNRVLLAYFSRAGENYFYGDRIDLQVGNTEVLAGLIRDRLACDVSRIEPVECYSADYDATVARNVQEQDADARPAIANPLASIEDYEVVLLGSPIWNVRAPMIMSTFAERFDFAGKRVFPVVTYAVSGLGTTERDYAALCPGAIIGEGLAVRGEEVAEGGAAIDAWLQRAGLRNS